MNPTKYPEVIALHKLRTEADKIRTKAVAWGDRLETARTDLVGTQRFFRLTLSEDARLQIQAGQVALTSIEAAVRTFANFDSASERALERKNLERENPAGPKITDEQIDFEERVAAVARGAESMRRTALSEPQVFIEFHAGFDRKLIALGERRTEATALHVQRTSDAMIQAAKEGRPPLSVDAHPRVSAARDVCRQIQNVIQSATVARNYAACGVVNCTPVSFESLLSQLESPLPALSI